MTRAFAVALAGLIYLPMTVHAQTDYDDQVRDFLATSGRIILEPQGFQSTHEVYTGSLAANSDIDHWITMAAGEEQAVLAVCDEDCSDIDLYKYDEEGVVIDSDASTDDVPVLPVTPRTRGRYRVQVTMYDCEIGPCFYAVGVYQGGGSVVGSDDYRGQADHYLHTAFDALLADDKYKIVESLYGNLYSSGDETFQVEMRTGNSYAMLGACDDDCGDMDLFLMDRGGNKLDSDTAVDSFPMLNFTPSASGTYTVRVEMFECSTKPCFFSVGVYQC